MTGTVFTAPDSRFSWIKSGSAYQFTIDIPVGSSLYIVYQKYSPTSPSFPAVSANPTLTGLVLERDSSLLCTDALQSLIAMYRTTAQPCIWFLPINAGCTSVSTNTLIVEMYVGLVTSYL